MEKYSSKIDAYIEKSQDFAKPVLQYIRETVHEFCPDVEETMKWSFPHFIYKGKIYVLWLLSNSIAPLDSGWKRK